MSDRIEHTIGAFIYKQAKVLLLGSLPSPKSREVGFYYGHPQNRFWKVLAKVFDEPVPETVDDKKCFLISHRIALWDVIESCEIDGASDASIKDVKSNDILLAIEGTEIVKIFTTGKTAHALLKRYRGIDSVCLPSTSPANCSVSFELLVEKYSEILNYV